MIINNNKLAELSSQRVNGLGGLSIHFKDGRSRISRLYQEGAAKIACRRSETIRWKQS